MLLVIDIGNTNIKFGVYKDKKLVASWRIATDLFKTGDEYGMVLLNLFAANGLKKEEITGVILSSVVPSVNYTIEHMLEYYIGKKPLIVGPGIKTGLNIKLDNPKELGGDMICDAVSAFKRYGGPCIVIDFGTATTLSYTTANGEFMGGCICPGVKVAVDALIDKASKLPRIELVLPEKVIGKSTVACMQSGLLYGYIGQIEYLVRKMKEEAGLSDMKVVSTGGMARVIAKHTSAIDVVDPMLTLEGLRLLYELNN